MQLTTFLYPIINIIIAYDNLFYKSDNLFRKEKFFVFLKRQSFEKIFFPPVRIGGNERENLLLGASGLTLSKVCIRACNSAIMRCGSGSVLVGKSRLLRRNLIL